MTELVLRNGRKIGSKYKPYIVAELNSSHNGNVETAKQMIDAAKDCGCDCVKFQSWSAESLYADEYYKNNPISKRIVTKFSLAPLIATSHLKLTILCFIQMKEIISL